MLNSKEIREKYLNFFKRKEHTIITSASLLPENDSTILFVNSGMSPLVPFLSGEKHPAGKRLVNFQKCFRAEDIDEVGDNRHNTFFEMLGNWSLGDYFKKEQLEWWYEFLIDELKINPEKLYQTVYLGNKNLDIQRDRTSISLLVKIFKKHGVNANIGPDTESEGEEGPGRKINFQSERIFAYCDKNWWQRGEAVGELGGPDSETFYDTGKEHNTKYGKYCHVNCDCGRFIEIGNSVFMQYKKNNGGWSELSSKNVDFGGGLERLTMIIQEKDNIFETDLFINTIKKIEELSEKKYKGHEKEFEIIADHLKAATFIIGDEKGVGPNNTDQGYIVRRLIRRAIRFSKNLGIMNKIWISKIAEIVINDYKDVFIELDNNKNTIINEFNKEEKKFTNTLEKGLVEFSKLTNKLKKLGLKTINGKNAFNLYQTYGFPIEITKDLAYENKLLVDINEFNNEIKKHQNLSRQGSEAKFKGGLADSSDKTKNLHTATHLMLHALRKILGNHVEQKGSNITTERLRFDFSHDKKLTDEQINKIEDLVNKAIKANANIKIEEMSTEEAKKQGAIGVFDSMYGKKVKVYTVSQGNIIYSKEICGGPHTDNTADLGHFQIKKQSSVSAGVRRIKAILTLNS